MRALHSANEAREVHQHQYAKKMALLSLVRSPTYFTLPAVDAWRSTCHAHPLVWLVFCDTLQACVALTCIVVLWDHVDTSLMVPYSCADDDSFIMPPPQCVCVCPPTETPPHKHHLSHTHTFAILPGRRTRAAVAVAVAAFGTGGAPCPLQLRLSAPTPPPWPHTFPFSAATSPASCALELPSSCGASPCKEMVAVLAWPAAAAAAPCC